MKSVEEILITRHELPRAGYNRPASQTRPRRGFTIIENSFIERTDLNIYEKLVVIVIKKHCMNRGRAWPSQARLAEQVGCSISTIKRIIKNLEKIEILTVERNHNHKNNIYKI
jgi:DNA-binding MarR family transcriptional regulator